MLDMLVIQVNEGYFVSYISDVHCEVYQLSHEQTLMRPTEVDY